MDGKRVRCWFVDHIPWLLAQDADLAAEHDGAEAAPATAAARQPFEAMQLLQNARVRRNVTFVVSYPRRYCGRLPLHAAWQEAAERSSWLGCP